MRLSQYPKTTNYSGTERTMFDLMPKDGTKIGSHDLMHRRYLDGPWDVENPLNIISVIMNKLIRKVKENDEDFVICKDKKRTGNHKVAYWVKPRGH